MEEPTGNSRLRVERHYRVSLGDLKQLCAFCTQKNLALLDLLHGIWTIAFYKLSAGVQVPTTYLVSEENVSDSELFEIDGDRRDSCVYVSQPQTNSSFLTFIEALHANTDGSIFEKQPPRGGICIRGLFDTNCCRSLTFSYFAQSTVRVDISDLEGFTHVIIVTDAPVTKVQDLTSTFKAILKEAISSPSSTIGSITSINNEDNRANGKFVLSTGSNDASEFWTRHLSDSNTATFPALPLPTYQPSADTLLSHDVSLSKAPISSLTIAAWALVSAQYMDQKNVTFGVSDVQGHSAPFQVSVDKEMPVSNFIEKVEAQSEEMSLFKSSANLQYIRKLNAATEVACNFQTQLVVNRSSKSIDFSTYNTALTLEFKLSSSSLQINASFDEKVVDVAHMQRIIWQVDHILQKISTNTSSHITIADITSINNRDKMELVMRNKTLPPTIEKCVHHVIDDQIRAHRDAPAIFAWDGKLTYGELDDLSSRLGRHLRTLGVKPEVFVPFCFEKSKWTVVTVLGIMKAGGVGVPLEPAHPIDRRKAMVDDVGAKLVICSRLQLKNCSGLGQLVTVDLATISKLPKLAGTVSDDVSPHNAAYMIFTSGSTGKAKGIVLEHKTLSSSISEHGKRFCFTRHPRVLQFAAHVFDISVADMFTTLCFGGCICIPSDHDRMNNLVGFINDAKVDWCFFTPTLARLINPDDIRGVKTVLLGGEKIGQDNIENWRHKVQLFAVYGPAETGIYCSGNEVSIGNPSASSIGTTFGGNLWITESTNVDNLVPIGVVGEIIIEGPILARGYFADPDKTANAFVMDPQWSRNSPGEHRRFYRTGDLGKYGADGTIMFVGRKDGQVKMRGQRMELGEVEHHLLECPFVKHAISMVPSEGLANGRLVAVITLSNMPPKDSGSLNIISARHRGEVASQIGKIREYLAAKLPVYMIPTLWLPMEEIPLNTSRKLDRFLIKQWVARISQETLYEASQLIIESAVDEVNTPTEKKLQQIWSRVLNLPSTRIGSNSSFLKLGGDSITAIQVTSRCRMENLELTVQDILRYKSLGQIASRIKESTVIVESVEELVEKPFEMSPIQRMHVARFPTVENHFNQSFLLKLNRPVNQLNLRSAIEDVIARHSMLRARFEWSISNKKWTQLISPDIATSFFVAEYSVSSIEAVEQIVLRTQTSFDIVSGPLFGVALVNVDDGSQFLFLAAHHIVIDLVSWRIVLEDLEEILVSGSLSAPKSLPFSTWVQMQQQYAEDHITLQKVLPFEVRPADFGYWGMSDRPNLSQDGIKRTFSVDKETSAMLLGLCNETMRTDPVDLLLSAVMHSFAQTFTDRDLPTVFNEGHGREPWDTSVDLSRTVGWFTIMSPICIQGSDRNDLAQIIRETKDARHMTPKHGFDYFTARFLTDAGREAFAEHGNMEILFNYFGIYQQLEQKDGLMSQVPVNTLKLHDFSPTLKEWALFEIEVGVEQGELTFTFAFSEFMKHQDKIAHWFEQCKTSVSDIVTLLAGIKPEFTLSDFSSLSIKYPDLDRLVKNVLPELGISGRDEIEDIYPCTAMQEGILIAQSKAPQSYKVQEIFAVSPKGSGVVNIAQLERSWQKLVKRHAILRTIFISSLSDDSLYQQVVLQAYLPRAIHVLANSREDGLRVLKERPDADYSNQSHPAHQITICQLENGSALIKLEISHTLIDLTSTQILCKELGLAYDEVLPTATGLPYSDYIDYIQSQEAVSPLSYWRNYLADIKACHFQLLNDGYEGTPVLNTIEIPFHDAGVISSFCKTHGITMNNVISAIWALLLQSYTGENGVCFGYLVSGRDLPVNGIQDIVGPFINMLICRVDLDDSDPVVEVMSRIQADYVNGSANQVCSLAEVQHNLDLGGKKLFNTAISLDRMWPQNLAQESSISLQEIDLYDPTDIEMVLNVAYSETDFRATVTYTTAWISDKNAANIADTFSKILTSILETPGQLVAEIDRLGPQNKSQLVKWNSNCPGHLNVCVHEAFHEQSLIHADLPAVSSWDGDLSYKTLDDMSTRLSHHLVGLGIGLEIVVPLAFDKSKMVIVSQLAILKAGGACLTMDMSHPVDRLQGMCDQVSAKLMLIAPPMVEKFKGVNINQLVIDESFVWSLPAQTCVPSTNVQPSNMGFVVFTSGSTGKPKGIMLEHKTVCTSSRGHAAVFDVGPGSRCLQFSAFAFDVHISDIFTPIMYGGCCCIPNEEDRMNDLAGAINKLNANRGYITPTVATLFKPDDVPCFKMVALGGEPLTKENAKTWGGKVRLINVFGPSETSNWVSYHDVKPETTQPSNIGPGVDVNIWLLDYHTNSRLIPIGCVGEMFVEGPTLARGYYNDEEKTRAALIENPAWLPSDGTDNRRRVYGTGDLVRANSDGTLLYVGRKDSQVKVHGQRLELGEVEYALVESPEVRHVSVVLPKSGLCKGKLVAVIALNGLRELPESRPLDIVPESLKSEVQARLPNIMDRLAVKLPAWMNPHFWAIVTSIPTSASGKLDRALIKNWVAALDKETLEKMANITVEKQLAPPTTIMEKRLQKEWSQVLQLPLGQIGVDSSFLRLGGDSLFVMRLVTAARSSGIILSTAAVFGHPKLRDMALVAKTLDVDSIVDLKPFDMISDVHLADVKKDAQSKCNIEEAMIQDIYPCTPLQEGLMALSLGQPGAFVAQNVYKLPTEFDNGRFKAAWQQVFQLNEILRSRIFNADSSGTLQVVIDERIAWKSGINLKSYLEEDKATPMLLGEPLIRLAIIENHFVMTAHHAVYDGWSLSALLEEVTQTYQQQETIQRAPFKNFIQHLRETDNLESVTFWKAQLSNSNTSIFPQLPSPNYQPNAGTLLVHDVQVMRNYGSEITTSTIIRAAWALVASQYTDSDDVTFGLLLSGRNAPVVGVVDIMAPTIATVPVQIKIDHELPVSDFLLQIQNQATEMMQFEQTGLQRIKKINSDTEAACRFQSQLVIQPASIKVGGFSMLGIDQINDPADDLLTYILTLECVLTPSGATINALFDKEVIAPSQMKRILRQFEHIMNQLCIETTGTKITTIGSLVTVSIHDMNEILAWNQTLPMTVNKCVHHSFEEQVAIQPESVALSSWDGELSYAELNKLSNKLGYYLRKNLGVRAGFYVPFCFEKSIWSIVSILAVMKAGGVCVPLEPAHPRDRKQEMADAVNATIILSSQQQSQGCLGIAEKLVVVSETIMDVLPEVPGISVCNEVRPEHPVYVIFTSGSTGKPKPVVWLHSTLSSSLAHHGPRLHFDQKPRVLQVASPVFDASVGEVMDTLVFGGCLCIPSDHDKLTNIVGYINSMKVNWIFLTPTFARLMDPDDVPNLKTLVLGGEAIGQDNIRRWSGRVQLINAYGPSECCILCCSNEFGVEQQNPDTIGSAVGGNIWIVDSDDIHKLLPIGAVGEMLVEGPTLAVEYLNNSEKTAESFVDGLPWAEKASAVTPHRRFYRTGDLGKYNPDRSISFFGRKDNQVKLNGQRMELGEIEYHLAQNDLVKHAMALIPSAGPFEGRLVAALTFSSVSALEHDLVPLQILEDNHCEDVSTRLVKIGNELTDKLPPYMVPTIWIPLQLMPLTTSGKLDRVSAKDWLVGLDGHALDRIAKLVNDGEEGIILPVTQMEIDILDIWSHVLNLPADKISVGRPFLKLGGDSITAIQVTSRCRTKEIDVTVQDILRYKTIREIALHARATTGSIVIAEEPVDTDFDLSPIQQLHMIQLGAVERSNINKYNFNQSFLLKLNSPISKEDLRAALDILVHHHSMLRARFAWSHRTQKWTQRVVSNLNESVRLGTHEVTEIMHLEPIIARTQASLDIESGPLFAADHFNLQSGGDQQLLFLTAHHLIIDLVSWRILLQDIEEILITGALASAKTLTFQTWLSLQAIHSKEINIATALPFKIPSPDFEYWGMANQPNLVEDHIHTNFSIDKKLTSLLLGASNTPLNTEPVDLLLSAIIYAFNQTFRDRQAPAIFNESHGREPWNSSIDLSRTVGWFTTLHPISVTAERHDVSQIIREVKDVRRSIPMNGWSYFNSRFLTEDGAREFSDHGMMEVVFNYSGIYQQFERKDSLLGLTATDLINLHEQSPLMEEAGLFNIGISVVHGALQFSLTHNKKMKHQAQIIDWSSNCQTAIMTVVDYLFETEPQVTLADFPLLSIEYSDLEILSSTVLPELGIRTFSDIEDIYPCSPMQVGILVAQAKQSGDYKLENIFKVGASQANVPIDVGRIEAAWQKVVKRHPILRTVFIPGLTENSTFDQVVLKNYSARTYFLRADSETSAIHTLQDYSPIDYNQSEPSHRLGFCETESGEVLCRLETSHALVDAVSTKIIIKEICLAYDRQLSDRSGPLYSEYVSYICDQSAGSALEYWKEYLSDVEACYLPMLQVRNSDGLQHKTSTVNITIPHAEQLHNVCRSHGLTVANIVQTAWALVLQSYTGNDKVCFGYLASGRDLPIRDVEECIGPLINMLVCHLDLTSAGSLLDILKKVQADYVRALPYQVISLAEIQHVLSFTGERLFNTGLSVQKKTTDNASLRGTISFDQLEGYDPSDFDMVINVAYSDDTLEATINYATSGISKRYAELIGDTFIHIISGIINSPEQAVVSMDRLGPQNEHQIFQWNSSIPPAVHECVHHRIEQQALARPDAPAVCAWDGNLSYKELNGQATRLAQHLRSIGVRPEIYVPFCFEKSMWTVVAALAIIKAGGVCVPLDPTYPDERKKLIIEDVKATIILCSEQQTLSSLNLVDQVVTIGPQAIGELPDATGPVSQDINPENAVYVIFTSGSTGKPKGVVWSHESLSSTITYQKAALNFGEDARVLQFASHVFDASAMEMFTTTSFGGCICIPSDEDKLDIVKLSREINRMEANHAFLTPTFARLINPDAVPTLRTLILGGEAIGRDNIDRWASKLQLINGFGPSECTISCAANPIVPGSSSDTTDSIGSAIGSRIWITDSVDVNKLQPIGVVGEILVEGPILARCYLNDEDKTDKAFIKDPIWAQSDVNPKGRRFYRTGDLAKLRFDGTLSLVGRRDNQVKVRGQRMEIDEVEHHLSRCGSVKTAVITVPKVGSAVGRLVVVLTLSTLPNASNTSPLQIVADGFADKVADTVFELQEDLGKVLPAYMIPTVWLPVEEIPLTVAGKLDRARVKSWVAEIPQQTLDTVTKFVTHSKELKMPTNTIEKRLQEIWSLVLNLPIEQIGMNSSFLTLGGDSITAINVTSRCRAKDIGVKVQDILRYKTISEIALHATHTSLDSSMSNTEELIDVPFDLSPIQQMHIDSFSTGDHFNQSFLLKLTKNISLKDLRSAIEILVGHHSMLRARFELLQGQWTQKITSDASTAYHLDTHKVMTLRDMDSIISQTQALMHIQTGPLFAAELFQVNPKKENYQLLFITAHHLVIDLVSWRIVLQDLEEILLSGTLTAPKTLPFQSWVGLQHQHTKENIAGFDLTHFDIPTADFDYWGMAGKTNLGCDHVDKHFSLNKEQSGRILGTSNKPLNTEPLDLLLGATVHAFARTFHRQIPAIFNEGHGREPWDSSIDISRTVGWFTTLFPVFIETVDRNNITQTVRQIKDRRHVVQKNGWSYFNSRFLTPEGAKLFAHHKEMEIVFNYTGNFQQFERQDSLLKLTSIMDLHEQSPLMEQTSLFNIGVTVINGIIKFSFSYNRTMRHQDLIASWISSCKAALGEIANTFASMKHDFTLADFPHLRVNYTQLGRLLKVADSQMPKGTHRIEDILPASDYQVSSLASTLSKGRGDLNYLIFEIQGALDLAQLHESCRRLLARHSILRTVFIAFQKQIWQIVLESGKFDFQEYQGNVHTPENPSPAILKDLEDSVGLSHHYLRFMLLNHGVDYHSLVLRLPHALFDSVSMGVIIHDLQDLYAGKMTMMNPSFRNFVAYKDKYRLKSRDYWSDYLEGSSVTQFHSRPMPIFGDGGFSTVAKRISPSTLLHHGINSATLVKAAWGAVLAQLSATTDILFGDLVNGRNAPVEGLESMSGVCINHIPLRIQLEPSMTVLDLLHQVHDRQLSSMPFEFLGTNEIINNCTNWPSWTVLGSTINHTPYPFSHKPLASNGTEWSFQQYSPGGFMPSLGIETHPIGDDLNVEMNFSDSIFPQPYVEGLLDILCSTIVSFSSDVSTPVRLEQADSQDMPRIPFNYSYGSLPRTLTPTNPKTLNAVTPAVQRVWDATLGISESHLLSSEVSLDTPFYEVWEQPVAAAQFVHEFQLEGFNVSVDDILNAPTMRQQIRLCATA